MSKVIKLTLSDEDHALIDTYARKNNHTSIPALVKYLLNDQTQPFKRFQNPEPETQAPTKELVQTKVNKFSAEFVKKFQIAPDADAEDDEDEGRAPLDYVVRGDCAYPVYRQYGIASPCLDIDEAFWVPLINVKNKSYCVDVTDSLDPEENLWLDCWIADFQRMDELWWYRCNEVMSENRKLKRRDCLKILRWFEQGKTYDMLFEEDSEGGIKESFVARQERELPELTKEKPEDKE